jgi:hypothetical protein|tara:strand:+ start:362 stop:535 length:174 start_codon:yes stop_codon:yes gene_type:complete
MQNLGPDLVVLSIVGIYSLAILLFNKSAQKPEPIPVKSKKCRCTDCACSKKAKINEI